VISTVARLHNMRPLRLNTPYRVAGSVGLIIVIKLSSSPGAAALYESWPIPSISHHLSRMYLSDLLYPALVFTSTCHVVISFEVRDVILSGSLFFLTQIWTDHRIRWPLIKIIPGPIISINSCSPLIYTIAVSITTGPYVFLQT